MCIRDRKKTIAISTGLLAYTFTKLGDNLTNSDRDLCYSRLYPCSQLRLVLEYHPHSHSTSRVNELFIPIRMGWDSWYIIPVSFYYQCDQCGGDSLCRDSPFMECLDNVITEQCGEEIANSLHQLGDKLNDHFGCGAQAPQAIPRREYIFAFINRSM